MAVTDDDVRVELGFSEDDWTEDDTARATAIITRSTATVRSIVGGARVDQAIEDEATDKLAAIDDAVMMLAISRFANPEGATQRRLGTDHSVSWPRPSEALAGIRSILDGAFGARAGTTTL